ncbi:MAG: hypothetical protein QM757_14800 [Paludibaculum sp.]
MVAISPATPPPPRASKSGSGDRPRVVATLAAAGVHLETTVDFRLRSIGPIDRRAELLITRNRTELIAYVAGRRCSRCPAPPALNAYWRERLCHRCARSAAHTHDRDNTWPTTTQGATRAA